MYTVLARCNLSTYSGWWMSTGYVLDPEQPPPPCRGGVIDRDLSSGLAPWQVTPDSQGGCPGYVYCSLPMTRLHLIALQTPEPTERTLAQSKEAESSEFIVWSSPSFLENLPDRFRVKGSVPP